MAKARMLHKKISLSLQVNELPLPARLLFTWLISHADDEGRLKGDPKYIKGSVVPLTNWPPKLIRTYLELMNKSQLIYYWQENNEWFIQFRKWEEYQSIRKDRLELSKLPSFHIQNDNQLSTKCQPTVNQKTAQANISKSNVIEVNKSEYKEEIADKDIDLMTIHDESLHISPTNTDKHRQFLKERPSTNINKQQQFSPEDPSTYKLKDEKEVGARMAWEKLEPDNPSAFFTTYLNAAHKGLPASRFYLFVSEIKQSNTKNPGAVFNTKVKDYFEKKNA